MAASGAAHNDAPVDPRSTRATSAVTTVAVPVNGSVAVSTAYQTAATSAAVVVTAPGASSAATNVDNTLMAAPAARDIAPTATYVMAAPTATAVGVVAPATADAAVDAPKKRKESSAHLPASIRIVRSPGPVSRNTRSQKARVLPKDSANPRNRSDPTYSVTDDVSAAGVAPAAPATAPSNSPTTTASNSAASVCPLAAAANCASYSDARCDTLPPDSAHSSAVDASDSPDPNAASSDTSSSGPRRRSPRNGMK